MNKKKKAKKKPVRASTSSGFGMMFPYAGSIRPGKQTPQRVVTQPGILLPDYAKDGNPKAKSLPWGMVEVKKPEEIEKMRAAGRAAREVLDLAGRAVQVGVTTDEIDALVHEAALEVRPQLNVYLYRAIQYFKLIDKTGKRTQSYLHSLDIAFCFAARLLPITIELQGFP